MKKLIFLTTLFLTFPLSGQKTDQRLKGLSAELEGLLDQWNVAGFAVAIVEKDQVVYSKGFGFRDLENKYPVTPATVFPIGSCTKSFTSALLGVLRSEGKLDFDESPITYLPELSFYNREMNDLIVVKDLMSHRTGLPRHDYSWTLFRSEDPYEILKRIEYQPPFAKVRERWHYNNLMFMVQGLIAEKLSEKTWEQNLKELFLEPLGMNNASLSIEALTQNEDFSFGYYTSHQGEIKKEDFYDIGAVAPAGGINGNVTEMANWVMTWINGGEFQGQEIIPSSYVREAASSHAIVADGFPSNKHPEIHFSNYGYGWFTSSYRGHYMVEHGGNINGFTSSMAFFPSDSVGVVVLSNQNVSSVPVLVRNIVADRMLDIRPIDWNGELKKREANSKQGSEQNVKSDRVAGTQPSHRISAYAGNYENPGYGQFEIRLEGDSLIAAFEQTSFYLNHFHYDVFEAYELGKEMSEDSKSADFRFNFVSDNSGEIAELSIRFEVLVDPVVFKRTPNSVLTSLSDLMVLAGDYALGSSTNLTVVLRAGSTLFAIIPGQPEYELISKGNDRFGVKSLDGFELEFHKKDGQVTSVSIIQPNGILEAKRRE